MEFPVLCLSCLSTLNSVSLFLRCTFAFSSTCCLSSSDPATYFNPSPATSHNLLFSSSLYYVIPLLYFKPSQCVECLLLAWCSPLRAPCGIAFLGRQEVTQSRQGERKEGDVGVRGRGRQSGLMVMTGTMKPNKTEWKAKRRMRCGKMAEWCFHWDSETSDDHLGELIRERLWLEMEEGM